MKPAGLQEVSEGDKGIVLLELLIAVVIFCIAVFSSVMIFKNSLIRFSRKTGEKKVYTEATRVLNYLERYLSSAMCNDMEGGLRIIFEGGSDYIRFVSPFSEGPESDLAKFGIYFERETNTVKVSVIRIDRKSHDFVFPSGFPGAQVLGENIADFHLSYYDGHNWNERWNTEYMSEAVLPRIIKVEIKTFSSMIEGKRYEETFEKFIRINTE